MSKKDQVFGSKVAAEKFGKHKGAERVAWFEKTSDAFGFHTRTDIDSYLRLIRQRIQAKCNTNNDLIQMLRRNKVRGRAT